MGLIRLNEDQESDRCTIHPIHNEGEEEEEEPPKIRPFSSWTTDEEDDGRINFFGDD